jgi:hypothetical protein
MLAVSPFRNTATTKDESQEQMESYSTIVSGEFPDFCDGDLLESIDFDDLFVSINEKDVLPNLEMDPEILAEFSVSGSGGEESDVNTSMSNEKVEDNSIRRKDEEDKFSGSGLDSSLSSRGEEIVSKKDESVVVNPVPSEDGEKGRKPTTQGKNNNNQRKRKMKVNKLIMLLLFNFIRVCFSHLYKKKNLDFLKKKKLRFLIKKTIRLILWG